MRNEKYLLAFNATKDFSQEVDNIIEIITGWDDDILWRTDGSNLVEMIEEKIVEIDTLLSRIDYIMKVHNWELIETWEEIKRAIKEWENKIDTIKKTTKVKV